MRVLAIIHYPVYGGPHNNIVRLHGPLAACDVDLRVVLPREAGNAADWMRSTGVPVEEIPLGRIRATHDIRSHLRFLASFPGDVLRIARLLRRDRIDIVLLPGLANPHGAIAGRLLRKAVVWQMLDTRTPLVAARVLMPIVGRLADAAMFWGEALIAAHGNPKLNIPVIVNSGAVDTSEFRPSRERRESFREALAIPLDAVVIGTVASWYPTKGIDLFIEAARSITERHPDVWFVVVGDPQPGHQEHAEIVKALASSCPGLRDRVRFTPARRDLESVYPAYDVMVVSSRPASEGLATTVLEAMSCGLPVVASDVGATGDAVQSGHTGELFPAGDVAGLTHALTRLITVKPSERELLGERSRALAVERYDVGVAARTHEVAFQAALAHRRQRAHSRSRSVAALAAVLNRRLTESVVGMFRGRRYKGLP